WEKRSLPNVGDGGLEVSFVDQLQGWSVHRRANETDCRGAGEDVWHTTDGGGNWEPIAPVQWTMPKDAGIGYAQCKDGLSFIKAALGFLGASDPDHRPTIYRTLDGGKTWLGSTLSDPPDFKTSPGFALRAGRAKLLGTPLAVCRCFGPAGGGFQAVHVPLHGRGRDVVMADKDPIALHRHGHRVTVAAASCTGNVDGVDQFRPAMASLRIRLQHHDASGRTTGSVR